MRLWKEVFAGKVAADSEPTDLEAHVAAANNNNNTASTELEHRWDIKLAYWVGRKKWFKKG